MNIGEIFSESLRFPFSNLERLLAFALLMATSILIIPGIFDSGYTLRIMEYTFKGSYELPPFDKWTDMFVDGLKYIVVRIIYIGIPAFITAIITTGIVMASMSNGNVSSFSTFLNTFLHTLLVVGIIIMTIPYILSLIALPHIVKKNRLEDAVKFKEIFAIIKNMGWSVFIIGVVVLIAISSIPSALDYIPRLLGMGPLTFYGISIIVAFFVGSYLEAFTGRFQALFYQEGIEKAPEVID
jgi:hypothetical protein